MKRLRDRTAPTRVFGSVLAFCAVLTLSGCNSGALLALLLLGDDDGGGGGPLSTEPTLSPIDVEIVALRNARTRPAESELTFRLISGGAVLPSSVRVEYAVPGEEGFRPATLVGGAGVVADDPGLVVDLDADPDGRAHTVLWDAFTDLDQAGRLAVAMVRVTTGSALSDQREFVIGNDPPEILDVSFDELGDGDVDVTFRLADSSLDLVDVAMEYSTSLEDGAFLQATAEGEIQRLSTVEGNEHSIVWKSKVDLGSVDRTVQVRLSPRDRIEGSPAAEGEPFADTLDLDNNAPPEVELREGFLLDSDSRRGQALSLVATDADGDPVDLVVQWAVPGLDFPDLPPGLDGDAALRESLLADAGERRAHQIITLRTEPIEGRVEEPAPGLVLDAGEVLATWIKRQAELRGLRGLAGSGGDLPATLAGSRVELVPPAGGPLPAQPRSVCAYDPATGILRLDEPFDPPALPGDLLRIEIGGVLLLGSSPEGRMHQRIWDSRADLPGGGAAELRVTPYDRAADLGSAALGDGAGVCFATGEFSAENATVASRGAAFALPAAKTLAGPFGLRPPLLRDLAPGSVPAAVTSADLDGDGRLDVVAVIRAPDMLVVSRQTAPGIFDPDDELRLLDARMGSPRDVAVADLDGDGDLDVAVAGDGENAGVMLFLNEDLDLVRNRILLGHDDLVEPSAIVAADVDGDEDMDLVVSDASSGGPRAVVFHGGSPSGAPCAAGGDAWTACAAGGTGSAIDLAVADLDGDERPDLVLGGPGRLSISLQTSPGEFEVASAEIAVPGAVFESVAVSDIDGDDTPDVVLLDTAGSRAVAALQRPAMQFTIEDLGGSLGDPVDLAVEDVDGNGEVDLVIADAGPSGLPEDAGIAISLAAGDFYSTSFLQRTSGALPAVPRAVAARDIDGDGALDIVSADGSTHELAVHLQDVAGRFSAEARVLATGMALDRPRALSAADLDGDGRIDLAVPSLPSGDVTLLLQRHDGPWQSVSVAMPAELDARGPIAVALADVDGDGRADLATANIDADSVAILYQSEDGSFGSRAVELVADGALDGPETVQLADIDGDGRLDVITAGRVSNDVVWFRQETDGTFADGVEVAGGSSLAGPISLVAADLDGDGRTDLAVAGHRSENVVILYQSASRGEFDTALEVALPAGTFPVQVVAGENDADGVAALAVVSLGAAPVARLERQGPRGYDVSTVLEDGTAAATAVAAADVDADGSADIVWADADEIDPSIHLLMASPDGEPLEKERTLRSDDVSAPAGILVFDLDGDGEPDIISANRESGNVTVFYGGR